MLPMTWTRWATCALALSICVPAMSIALADRGGDKKSIASCASFGQEDKGEDKVQFSIHNTCTVPVDCSISWRLVCAPESKKRRAVHLGAVKLALANGTSQTAEASAAICGDAGWSLDNIAWSCQPTKD